MIELSKIKLKLNRKLVGSFTNLHVISLGTHHMALKVYNKIPLTTKNIEKENILTNKLKSFSISNCFYSSLEFFLNIFISKLNAMSLKDICWN